MIEYVPGNLWGKVLDGIDNDELSRCCISTEKFLLDNVMVDVPLERYGSKTTALFDHYNLMSMPLRPFQNLYHKMVEVIKPCLPAETHMLQCWLNIFRGGESIKWHNHWPAEFRAIHGFYCVHVTPSFTEYRFARLPGQLFRVDSKEGLLVFGKSNDDEHRSSPWQDFDKPRITIAFDLIPLSTMTDDLLYPNHFVPF